MPKQCSTKPLVTKLGIKPAFKIALLHAPADYDNTLGPLPEGTAVSPKLAGMDFIQAFFTSAKDLRAEFPKLKDGLAPAGSLWVCWPKKAAKVETDLTENVVREIGLASGLVEVKVCAVNEVWSGLKFVYRLKDR